MLIQITNRAPQLHDNPTDMEHQYLKIAADDSQLVKELKHAIES